MRTLLCLALMMTPLAVSAATAPAPPSAAPCPAGGAALPAGFAGWGDPVSVTAGTRAGDGATLAIGTAAKVSLHPARHLTLVPGGRSGDRGQGGTLTLPIEAEGTYRVALSDAAWIDLAIDGKAVATSAHEHGPACTGIRKIVQFRLTPGTYVVQLSGNPTDAVTLMVTKS